MSAQYLLKYGGVWRCNFQISGNYKQTHSGGDCSEWVNRGKSHNVRRHTCTQTQIRHTVVQKHKDKEVTVLMFSHSSAGESKQKQVIPLLLNVSFTTVKINQRSLMLCCYGTNTVKESSAHVCEDSQTPRLYRMPTSATFKKPSGDVICSISNSLETNWTSLLTFNSTITRSFLGIRKKRDVQNVPVQNRLHDQPHAHLEPHKQSPRAVCSGLYQVWNACRGLHTRLQAKFTQTATLRLSDGTTLGRWAGLRGGLRRAWCHFWQGCVVLW